MTVDSSGLGISVQKNLIDGYRSYYNEIWGETPVTGDPQFVSLAIPDYRLLPDSPAIDVALSTSVPVEDFDGAPRPFGPGYDLGAFEWHQIIFFDGFESGDTDEWVTTQE
jgi:hypothetical protein